MQKVGLDNSGERFADSLKTWDKKYSEIDGFGPKHLKKCGKWPKFDSAVTLRVFIRFQ